MLLFGVLVFVEMTATHNAVADTVPPPIIDTNTIWDIRAQPYWIEYDVTVLNGATLYIDEGVTVKFNGSYHIIVEGDLIVTGQPFDKVIFTSNFSSPSPGDWGSIRFNESEYYNSRIKFATIEYATTGIHCENRTIAVENSLIRNNILGIYTNESGRPFISNCTITNNTGNGIDWMNHLNPIIIYPYPHNWIWNNIISYNGDKAINLMSYARNPKIVGNEIYSNGYGIYLNNAIAMILNNTISNNTYGIYSKDSSPQIGNGNIPGNNNIINNSQDGIYIKGNAPDIFTSLAPRYANITGNTHISFNSNNGIYTENSSPIIKNNTVRNCTYGIYSYYSSPIIEKNKIANCTNYGIYVVNNDPGGEYTKIENNTISNNGYHGIYLYFSNNNTVANNYISNNWFGIYLWNSPYNMLINNNVSSNTHGIDIRRSSHNNITDNQIWNSAYYNLIVHGSDKLSHNNTIATSNNVNGKPVYYFFDKVNQTVENLDAGHITLAWCNNVTLRDSSSTNGDPIRLIYTSNSNVDNCTASNNHVGIELHLSSSNNITNCNASSNSYSGIYVYHGSSTNNAIRNNKVLDNLYGIFLILNSYVIISGNNVSSNDNDGIYLTGSSSNDILNNIIGWNGRVGIYCDDSSSPTIDNNNTISYNTQGIYCEYYSSPTITWNDIHNNTDAGINSTSDSDPTINYNNIEDNLKDLNDPTTGYGVNNQDTGLTVDAENNWWGDASGPYHNPNNLLGLGNQVSNDVDFITFSTTKY